MRTGALATALTVAAVLVAACGDNGDAGDDPAAATSPATPRALAAVAIGHITNDPHRTRGEYSGWGDPSYVAAEVDYGVDPEGSEAGETLTVRLRVSRLSDLPADAQESLSCRPAQHKRGECRGERVDGGTLVYAWAPEVPEEEPGSASYTFTHDDEVAVAMVEGSDIEADPRSDADFDLDLDELRAVVLDPDFALDTSDDAIAAGARIPSYRGPEAPPKEPAAGATEPEALAAEVIRYAEFTPSAAGPSALDDLGPEAVGAHLEVPATRRWAPASVDILTVAGRAPLVDPMPCTDLNRRVRLDDGSMCFAWTEDQVARWTLATADRPGVLWLLGYHDNETYNRVETVAIKITTPDLDFDLFDPRASEMPEWWLALGPLTGAMNVGPNSEHPGDHPRVPNWQD